MYALVSMYLARNRERKKNEQYMAGYSFAVDAYFYDDVCIVELEMYPRTAKVMHTYTPFDLGIEQALRDFRLLGLPNRATELR